MICICSFRTILLCVVCYPSVHNVQSCALQSSCTSNNNGLGKPSRIYDCCCQPVQVSKKGNHKISIVLTQNLWKILCEDDDIVLSNRS